MVIFLSILPTHQSMLFGHMIVTCVNQMAVDEMSSDYNVGTKMSLTDTLVTLLDGSSYTLLKALAVY